MSALEQTTGSAWPIIRRWLLRIHLWIGIAFCIPFAVLGITGSYLVYDQDVTAPPRAMKRALEGVLPESILKREKRGFGAPIGAWFKQELAPLVADLLSPDTVRHRGLLDPEAVSRTIAEHEAQRADRTDHLLALVNLEIWARLYLDGASVEAVTADLKSKLAA